MAVLAFGVKLPLAQRRHCPRSTGKTNLQYHTASLRLGVRRVELLKFDCGESVRIARNASKVQNRERPVTHARAVVREWRRNASGNGQEHQRYVLGGLEPLRPMKAWIDFAVELDLHFPLLDTFLSFSTPSACHRGRGASKREN